MIMVIVAFLPGAFFRPLIRKTAPEYDRIGNRDSPTRTPWLERKSTEFLPGREDGGQERNLLGVDFCKGRPLHIARSKAVRMMARDDPRVGVLRLRRH
jgi:hypothetical protein